MTRLASALVILWLAAPAWAAGPAIVIPPVIPATSDYVTITPQTDAKSIVYVGLSGVDAFPSEFLKDPRVFILPVRGLAAGTYRFTAVGTLNDEQSTASFVVVVGTPPTPVPPTPVPPTPIPPAPESELSRALKTALALEAASEREKIGGLIVAMRCGAMWADDPTLASNAALVAKIGKEARDEIGTALPNTRAAIGKFLNALLPADDVPLTSEVRERYRNAYRQVADALEKLR